MHYNLQCVEKLLKILFIFPAGGLKLPKLSKETKYLDRPADPHYTGRNKQHSMALQI